MGLDEATYAVANTTTFGGHQGVPKVSCQQAKALDVCGAQLERPQCLHTFVEVGLKALRGATASRCWKIAHARFLRKLSQVWLGCAFSAQNPAQTGPNWVPRYRIPHTTVLTQPTSKRPREWPLLSPQLFPDRVALMEEPVSWHPALITLL